MAFGGMAPTTVMPAKTMKVLVGRKWSKETFDLGCDTLLDDLPLPPGVPGAMVRYRRALTVSFLFKAFLAVSKSSGMHPLPSDHESATQVTLISSTSRKRPPSPSCRFPGFLEGTAEKPPAVRDQGVRLRRGPRRAAHRAQVGAEAGDGRGRVRGRHD